MTEPASEHAARITETTELATTLLQSLIAAIAHVPAERFEEAAAALAQDPAYDDALLARFMSDVATWKRMAEEAERGMARR